MLSFIHRQVIAFLDAGKHWEEASGKVERNTSRLVAALLFLTAVVLTVAPFFEWVAPVRLGLRSMFIGMLVFGLAGRFWSGLSLPSILASTRHFWVPLVAISYAYLVMGRIVLQIVQAPNDVEIGPDIGVLTILFGVLGGVTSFVQARQMVALSPTKKASGLELAERTKIAALRLYSLIGFGALIGGTISVIALWDEGSFLALELLW